MAHLSLRALDALLNAERDQDPPAKIFESLQGIFAFDQALLLQRGEEGMRCVAALPETLCELQWTEGQFFREIGGGAVAATCGDRELDEWRAVASDLISPAQPALYLPYCAQGRRGVLILLRAIGKDAFDEADLSVARQLAVSGLASLAARHAQAIEAAFQGLRDELAQLREAESEARRNAELLKGIVELLPVGLTVQDEHGSVILLNEAAAARIEMSASGGNDPSLGDTPPVSPSEPAPSDSNAPATDCEECEETALAAAGARTWLVSRRPVRFLDETLLLSTSVDITRRKQVESELSRRAYSDD